MNCLRHVPRIGAAVFLLSALAGCGDKMSNAHAQGAGMPPPEVSVVTVEPQRIPLTTELPGRIEAYRVAQVRARVPGIVLKREFREGSNFGDYAAALDWLLSGRVKVDGLYRTEIPANAQAVYEEMAKQEGDVQSVIFNWRGI